MKPKLRNEIWLALTVGIVLFFLFSESGNFLGSVFMANPASSYCVQQGGQSQIITLSGGDQAGRCVFGNITCDEWELFRTGNCGSKTFNTTAIQLEQYCNSKSGTFHPGTDYPGYCQTGQMCAQVVSGCSCEGSTQVISLEGFKSGETCHTVLIEPPREFFACRDAGGNYSMCAPGAQCLIANHCACANGKLVFQMNSSLQFDCSLPVVISANQSLCSKTGGTWLSNSSNCLCESGNFTKEFGCTNKGIPTKTITTTTTTPTKTTTTETTEPPRQTSTPEKNNNMIYLGIGAAAIIGLIIWKAKKKRK